MKQPVVTKTQLKKALQLAGYIYVNDQPLTKCHYNTLVDFIKAKGVTFLKRTFLLDALGYWKLYTIYDPTIKQYINKCDASDFLLQCTLLSRLKKD